MIEKNHYCFLLFCLATISDISCRKIVLQFLMCFQHQIGREIL